MSTIAQQLQALATIKAAIKAAIEAKGVTVGDAAFDEYATSIASISSGGYSDEEIAAVFDKSITSFTLHEGATSLPMAILQQCSNLTYLDLPSTLVSIGANALSQSRKVETIICRATTPPSVSSNSFGTTSNSWTGYLVTSTKTLYVPYGCTANYTGATGTAWVDTLLDSTKCNFTIAELTQAGEIPTS